MKLVVLEKKSGMAAVCILTSRCLERATSVFVAVVVTVFGIVHPVSGQRYTITDLGAAGEESSAEGINDKGQVVGWWRSDGKESRAFIWQNGVMRDLGASEFAKVTAARKINNAGQVVGYGLTESEEEYGNDTNTFLRHAFLWQNGVIRGLAGLGQGYANDINDSGQIVGNSREHTASNWFGFLWQNGVLINLGENRFVHGINNLGEMVGFHQRGSVATAAIWRDDDVTYIGHEESIALDINNNGQVVGRWRYRAVLWLKDGSMLDLGTSGDSIALAINDLGQVVGSEQSSIRHHTFAFLYNDGLTIKLEQLIPPESGWYLYKANDINNHGEIVGSGLNPNGERHAFLLTLDNEVMVINTVQADFDRDGDVDLTDYLLFVECFTKAGQPHQEGCGDADLDGDGDVDLTDLVSFQSAFTGSR